MADYRPDCCGGYPSCTAECRAKGEVRLAQADKKKALLDELWALYGHYVAEGERSTAEHNKVVFGCRADGLKKAVRIVEARL